MPDPGQTNAVQIVDALIDRVITSGASDLHFEPADDALAVRQRLDGVLHEIDRLPPSLADSVVARLKVLAGLLTYRVDIPQEGSFQFGLSSESRGQPREREDSDSAATFDLRVATFPTIRGERVVVRVLHGSQTGFQLAELGLGDEVVDGLKKAVTRSHGLILVTGPAGSGKSTTLGSLARYMLTETPGRSVVSLEDPVEARIEGLPQIQINPHGELDYVRAMRSLLRQDVQVLLVGEIRDAATAHIVIEASLTGHLIISTMHSGDPAETIARLLEMGIASYQVVNTVSAIVSQRLVRIVCSGCSGAGCNTCHQTGFIGRSACGQLAMLDEPLRAAIVEHRPVSELRRLIDRSGTTLLDQVRGLLAEGKTTRMEIERVLGEHCDK